MAGKIILVIFVVLLVLVIVIPFILNLLGVNILQLGSVGGGGAGGGGAVIMRSLDGGNEWDDVSVSDNKKIAFPGVLFHLAFHPTKAEVIYLGTKGSGLWKSLNGGAFWTKVVDKASILDPRADVQKIGVSRQNPDVLYLAVYQNNRGRVLKSVDEGNSFKDIFSVTADRYAVSDLFVNQSDPENVIITTGQGGVFETVNSGKTWRVIKWFTVALSGILVNPQNTGEILVITAGGDIFKSVDRGVNWADLRENLTRIRGADLTAFQTPTPSFNFFGSSGIVQTLAADPNDFSNLYLAGSAGLFRSRDGGFTWERLNVLVPPDSMPLDAVAIHPQSPNTIFAAAGAQIYRSDDGGINWSMRVIPTRARLKALFIQVLNPRVMFTALGR